MEPGPYRTPPCAACSAPTGATIECLRCAQRCCADCAPSEVCKPCLQRALAAIAWLDALATKRPPRLRLIAEASRAVAALALGAIVGVTVSAASSKAPRVAAQDVEAQEVEAQDVEASVDPAPPASAQQAPGLADGISPEGLVRFPPASTDSIEGAAMAWPPAVLASAGPETHEPGELYARARRLSAAGLDMRILGRTITESELSSALETSTRAESVLPVKRNGDTIGLALYGFRYGSLPRALGLENGDVITAVNGYPVRSADLAQTAYDEVRLWRTAIIEAVRREQRIVVEVRFPSS